MGLGFLSGLFSAFFSKNIDGSIFIISPLTSPCFVVADDAGMDVVAAVAGITVVAALDAWAVSLLFFLIESS